MGGELLAHADCQQPAGRAGLHAKKIAERPPALEAGELYKLFVLAPGNTSLARMARLPVNFCKQKIYLQVLGNWRGLELVGAAKSGPSRSLTPAQLDSE